MSLRPRLLSPLRYKASSTPYWTSVTPKRVRSEWSDDEKPLVFVIIPHFNMGEYRHRTIDSVLASTYSKIEIIVVDDCSTDRHSQSVLDSIGKSSSRVDIHIVRCLANIGLSAARNFGIRKARVKYILTIDVEDMVINDFVEVGVNALEKNTNILS
ncbi:glycosyltransferase family 2 protein [Sphingomonas sp. QA11]|uniref:glycosyltransferase family 2 protein n=1 Tax=Sphingomonas sp. QA11 TaxID=2950605 RepID=UPI003FA734A9